MFNVGAERCNVLHLYAIFVNKKHLIRLIGERQKKGMQRMIEELYKKYHQELIGWCRNMTGNLHTAEELVQEAFLRAMLHEGVLASLQDQQCRSWLYRTVKNLYVDRVRHRKKCAVYY